MVPPAHVDSLSLPPPPPPLFTGQKTWSVVALLHVCRCAVCVCSSADILPSSLWSNRRDPSLLMDTITCHDAPDRCRRSCCCFSLLLGHVFKRGMPFSLSRCPFENQSLLLNNWISLSWFFFGGSFSSTPRRWTIHLLLSSGHINQKCTPEKYHNKRANQISARGFLFSFNGPCVSFGVASPCF